MEIIWRRRALNDLEALRAFITQDNPRAAARVLAAIRASVERLAAHPNLGRTGRVEGTRELIISTAPYIVAYRVVEDQIRILSMIPASRQWLRRLQPPVLYRPKLDQEFAMATRTNKTITISLPQEELAEFDRVREQLNLTRSQALRAALRWYIDAMRRLPPAEDMSPEEAEAIRRGKEQIARGEYVRLEDLQHELGLRTK